MKLRDHATGKVWEIVYIKTVDEFGTNRRFYGGYDLIGDLEGSVASLSKQLDAQTQSEPAACPHAETQIAELSKSVRSLEELMLMNAQSVENIAYACTKTLERVGALESEDQRLKDRLNAIEGLGIPR